MIPLKIEEALDYITTFCTKSTKQTDFAIYFYPKTGVYNASLALDLDSTTTIHFEGKSFSLLPALQKVCAKLEDYKVKGCLPKNV